VWRKFHNCQPKGFDRPNDFHQTLEIHRLYYAAVCVQLIGFDDVLLGFGKDNLSLGIA
jgi:hypothetical protein